VYLSHELSIFTEILIIFHLSLLMYYQIILSKKASLINI